MKKLVLLLVSLGFLLSSLNATNYYRTSANVWSYTYEGGTCSCTPDYTNDSLFVNRNLTLGASLVNTYLYVASGNTLTISSARTIDATSVLEIGTGAAVSQTSSFTVDAGGQVIIDGTWTGGGDGKVYIDGTVTINGSMNIKSKFYVRDGGVLNVYGELNIQGGTEFYLQSGGAINGSGLINKSGGQIQQVSATATINGVSGLGTTSISGSTTFLAGYPTSGNTSTWVTYTSGGMPATSCTSNLQVSGNLTLTADVSAKRIVVSKGFTVTIPSSYTLTSCENIINDGTIIVEDGGSLLESSQTSVNSGTGTYQIKRIEHGGSNHLSFMSSPITACSTRTIASNPCDIYLWDPVNQYYSFDYPSGYVGNCNGVSVTFTGQYAQANGDYVMDIARGYIVKQSGDSVKSFAGTVNNGTINYSIYTTTLNNAVGWSGDDWNLLGNPYPSALDLATFLTENAAVVSGGAYLWDDDGSNYAGYSSSDYLVYNGVGTSSSPNSSVDFNGKLASGQGFFIQAASNSSVSFNNGQRASGNNSTFFRQVAETNKTRIWLDLKQNNTVLSTALVGFMQDATLGIDNLYDANRVSGGNPYAINSMIGNETYVIQGLPTLFWGESVTVPLQVKVTVAGQYAIVAPTIEKALNTYEFWLIDNVMHTQINLSAQTEYLFNLTAAGANTTRFKLVVKNVAISLPANATVKDEHLQTTVDTTTATTGITSNSVDAGLKFNAAISNGALYFTSNKVVSQLELYTLEGKMMLSEKPFSKEALIGASASNGIYLLRYTTTSGEAGSVKILSVNQQ